MTKDQFTKLRVGDVVWAHFSNSYRLAMVTEKEENHATIEAEAAQGGGKITRRARYNSLSFDKKYLTQLELAAERRAKSR